MKEGKYGLNRMFTKQIMEECWRNVWKKSEKDKYKKAQSRENVACISCFFFAAFNVQPKKKKTSTSNPTLLIKQSFYFILRQVLKIEFGPTD